MSNKLYIRGDSGIEFIVTEENATVARVVPNSPVSSALIVKAVNNYTTLRAELDRVKARNKHLEKNLNAALACATVGDTFKSRQFMAKGLLRE